MSLSTGDTLWLNETAYRIDRFLGAGAVADVYVASLEQIVGSQVVIKLPREDKVDALTTGGEDAPHQANREEILRAIDGIRREAKVLRVLNAAESPQWPREDNPQLLLEWAEETRVERRIVALIAAGELDRYRPFVVQELAPPPFKRVEIQSTLNERYMLSVAADLAAVIALAHSVELSLKDFEPRTKGDRIRLRPLNDGRYDLKIIDWNITGDLGHVEQDLFYYGGHLYHMLFGRHLGLEIDQVPRHLDIETPGWENVTLGSRQIVSKLLHPDASRRYREASAVRDDLLWWLQTLAQLEKPDPLREVEERLWVAQGRADRVAATATLALTLEPPAEKKDVFEQWAERAKQEIAQEDYTSIGEAQSDLLTGDFRTAMQKLQKQLQVLPPEGEPARLARIYYQVSCAGSRLRAAHRGAPFESLQAWPLVNQAAAMLRDRRWVEACDAIEGAIRIQRDAAEWEPVQHLLGIAEAGLLAKDARSLLERAQPTAVEAASDNWAENELRRLEFLESALKKLGAAKEKSLNEPEYTQLWITTKGKIEWRRGLVEEIAIIEKLIAKAQQHRRDAQSAENGSDFEAAATQYKEVVDALQIAHGALKQILKVGEPHPRAEKLQADLQPLLAAAETRHAEMVRAAQNRQKANSTLEEGKRLLALHDYEGALSHFEASANLSQDSRVQPLLATAKVKSGLLHEARGKLEMAITYFNDRKLDLAKEMATAALHLDRAPAGALEMNKDRDVEHDFHLPEGIVDKLNALLNLIDPVTEKRQIVESAKSRGEYEQVLKGLRELEGILDDGGYALHEEEKEWHREGSQHVERWNELLEQVGELADSEEVVSILTNAGRVPADGRKELYARLAEAWKQWLVGAPDIAKRRMRFENGLKIEYIQHLVSESVLADAHQSLIRAHSIDTELSSVRSGREEEPCSPPPLDKLVQIEEDLQNLKVEPHELVTQGEISSWAAELDSIVDQYCDHCLDPRSLALKGPSRNEFLRWLIESRGKREGAFKERIERILAALESRQTVEESFRSWIESLPGDDSEVLGELENVRQHSFMTLHLPDPCPVWIEDLEQLRDYLGRVSNCAAVLSSPVEDDFASRIHKLLCDDLWSLGNCSSNPLPGVASDIEKLKRRTGFLLDQRSAEVRRTVKSMCGALQDKCVRVGEDPVSDDVEQLIRLYWQAQWWLKTGQSKEMQRQFITPTAETEEVPVHMQEHAPITESDEAEADSDAGTAPPRPSGVRIADEDGEVPGLGKIPLEDHQGCDYEVYDESKQCSLVRNVKDAVEKTEELPRGLAEMAANEMQRMESISDLERVSKILTHVMRLNRALATIENVACGETPYAQLLPRLPDDVGYEHRESLLIRKYLEEWDEIVRWLQEFASGADLDSSTDTPSGASMSRLQYDHGRVQCVGKRAQQMSEKLKSLRGCWQEMGIDSSSWVAVPEPDTQSSERHIGILASEAARNRQLVKWLNEAHEFGKHDEPGRGLSHWYRGADVETEMDLAPRSSWIFLQDRRELMHAKQGLRNWLRERFRDQFHKLWRIPSRSWVSQLQQIIPVGHESALEDAQAIMWDALHEASREGESAHRIRRMVYSIDTAGRELAPQPLGVRIRDWWQRLFQRTDHDRAELYKVALNRRKRQSHEGREVDGGSNASIKGGHRKPEKRE